VCFRSDRSQGLPTVTCCANNISVAAMWDGVRRFIEEDYLGGVVELEGGIRRLRRRAQVRVLVMQNLD